MSLDLSRATKLRDLVFLCEMRNIRWIVAALRTVESQNLQRITLRLHPPPPGDWAGGPDHLERQDLDRTLVQFWISHSIRPQFVPMYRGGKKGTKDRVSRLLPELTERGLVDVVEHTYPFREW